MKEKTKIQKGFIQIPLLIGIIVSIIIATGISYRAFEHRKVSDTALFTTITTTIQPTTTTKISTITTNTQLPVITTTVPTTATRATSLLPLITTTTTIVSETTTIATTTTTIPPPATTVPPTTTTIAIKQEVEVGTKVNGIISQDTIWVLKSSPYIITDDVLIEKGITLRIEPGVIVKFQEGKGRSNFGGFEILNKGNIIAKGNPNNKIIFTSLEPNPQLGDWGTIEVIDGGSINFDYTEIKYASTGVAVENASGIIITNSHFHDCGSGIFINKGPAIISNNLIENNYAGISFLHIPYSGSFDSGTFHYQGVRETKITYNTIRNNIGQSSNEYHTAIHIELSACLYSLIISHNDIYNNSGGIFIRETGGFNTSHIYKLPTIEQNNIYNSKLHYNNKDYAVFLNGESEIEIDMSNNWWGTTDIKVIDSLVYDYYDSFRPGIINYQPIATSKILDAGVQ